MESWNERKLRVQGSMIGSPPAAALQPVVPADIAGAVAAVAAAAIVVAAAVAVNYRIGPLKDRGQSARAAADVALGSLVTAAAGRHCDSLAGPGSGLGPAAAAVIVAAAVVVPVVAVVAVVVPAVPVVPVVAALIAGCTG